MTDPVRGLPATTAVPHPSNGPSARPVPGPGDELALTFTVPADQLLDALPDPTYVVDVDLRSQPLECRVVWVSSALADATGYTVEELREIAPDLVTADSDPTAMREALRAGLAVAVVRSVPRRDGSAFRSTVSFSPLGPGLAGTTRWLVTVRDATEELASAVLAEERASAEERARRGLSLVARVSDILADVDSATALIEISALLVRRIVPWAAFYASGTGLEQITDVSGITHHRRDLRRQARLQRDVADPVLDLFLNTRMQTVVIDRAQPAVEGTLTAELLELVAADETAPDDGGPLWLLPVLGRKEVLAVLAVHPPEPAVDERTMPAGELTTVLELVARRVGMAMDNLQLYDREHRLAETLQRAMLPEQSHVEGVDVWSYYAPSSEHAQVGGDWYDVLDMGEGMVGVVVGDVVGHDVEAAAAMGQLRSVVRAYAAEFVEPGKVLGRVDRLVASMRIARPASFVYATLQPRDDDEWDIAYSRAGHLPIVHVTGGRAQQLQGANGPLIGFGGRPRHTGHAVVHPGDVLIFYTDGLVERRDRSMRDGVAALVEAAAQIDSPDAAGIGEELLQRLADAPEDDIALVVVRVPDPAAEERPAWSGPRERRWQMPMDPETIARARHAVLRACEAWDIEDTAAAELVASELVANAVMHGWGRVDLRLRDTGDGLRIEVEDANPIPPVVREGRVGRVGGFGLHIIARLAEWGWRPTPAGKVVWARVRGKEPWSDRADQ